MDTPDLRVAPDPGMYGCDREVFAQIWRRVAPGESCPIELSGAAEPAVPQPVSAPEPMGEAPAPEAPSCPVTGTGEPPAEETCPACFGGGDGEATRLQELIRECLTGMAAYRSAARRGSRQRAELTAMGQKKTRHAKRLSAACFLMTGVRYWPAGNLPVSRPTDFFALLRERFMAEQRLYARLTALGEDAQDQCLRELYLTLAEETMELVHSIRLMVERET